MYKGQRTTCEFLSFCYVSPSNQVIRLGSRLLHPLNHLCLPSDGGAGTQALESAREVLLSDLHPRPGAQLSPGTCFPQDTFTSGLLSFCLQGEEGQEDSNGCHCHRWENRGKELAGQHFAQA